MFIGDFISKWKESQTLEVCGCGLSSAAFLVSKLAESSGNLLIVVPDTDAATKMQCALQAFVKTIPAVFDPPDVMPYVGLDPDADATAGRLIFLHNLLFNPPKIAIASAESIVRALPPPSYIRKTFLELKKGQRIAYNDLIKGLTELGFENSTVVEDVGTFSKRGSVIDVWSAQEEKPFRIEMDGDDVSSIRTFDPSDQRSKGELSSVLILPAQEMSLDADSRAGAKQRLKQSGADLSVSLRRQLNAFLDEGIRPQGMSTLMPLFYPKTATLLDYLGPSFSVVWFDPQAAIKKCLDLSKAAQKSFDECPGFEKAVPPSMLLVPCKSLLDGWAKRLVIDPLPKPDQICVSEATIPRFKNYPIDERWNKFMEFVNDKVGLGFKIYLTCHSKGQAARINDALSLRSGTGEKRPSAMLSESSESSRSSLVRSGSSFSDASHLGIFDQLPQNSICNNIRSTGGALPNGAPLNLPLEFLVGRLEAGFILEEDRIVVISDADLMDVSFLAAPVQGVLKSAVTSLSELGEGDLVVHERHGIGRFLGLSHLKAGGVFGDYLVIVYEGGDKLYVPSDKLMLVEKYSSPSDVEPELDKLGGTRWEKAKKKAKEAADEIAKELVDLYASRTFSAGQIFPPLDQSYSDFCAGFPFDETPDQQKAIEDVMKDMDAVKPMDRLVCGDVGFGKTEVALRAAYRAAMSGVQVAVLVPTTILALQHYNTFKQRFAPFPVRVEMLSRFVARKDQKSILADMAKGSVDIAIGTHKLLSTSVSFKRIGLLIVDEEHKFGVKHKEKIKEMKKNVDAITLTATPIPRTLYMSLIGIRDVSVISTAPSLRQTISTYVSKFDDHLIRRAVLTEVERSGQVFFVHNRVETIQSVCDHLKKILPEVNIAMGHGQMKEKDLERSMMKFLSGKAQVLLCTAIIESGLDIPNANTIIIDRADRFGLAELYQLRGRVGRSPRHAFAYLLVPRSEHVAPAAQKRLSALVRYTALGSGFQIAMHDLELRGAGNVLGTAQSGHIVDIGYEMYTKILLAAVKKQKGEEVEQEPDPELRLGIEAFLPEHYVSDSHSRMDLYRRLAAAGDEAALAAIEEEISDRFGPPPHVVKKLYDVMQIRLMAKRMGLRVLSADEKSLSLWFHEKSKVDVKKLLSLVGSNPERFQITQKSFIVWENLPPDVRLVVAKNTLREIESCVSPAS